MWDNLANTAEKVENLFVAQQMKQVVVPECFYLIGNLGSNHDTGLAAGPVDFRDGINESVRLENLVGSGLDDYLPVHVHVPDASALTGPVFSHVGFGSEMADADDAGGFLIADLDEDEAVACMGFLMFDNAPVEVVRRWIKVIIILSQDIDSLRKIEIVQETLGLVTREIGVPV